MEHTLYIIIIIAGAILLGFEIIKKIARLIHLIKENRARRLRMKAKVRRYRCGCTPTSTIRIANEFYNYSINQERRPIRKATGLFSDENAQKIVSETE